MVIELKGSLNSGGATGVANERLALGFCGFVVECRLDCERGGCIRENDWCDQVSGMVSRGSVLLERMVSGSVIVEDQQGMRSYRVF